MLSNSLRAKTTTTGTGQLTLSRRGSYPMPSDHPLYSAINEMEIGYTIKNLSGVSIETGVGTIVSSGTILQRSYPKQTWNPSTNALLIDKTLSQVNLTESEYDVDFTLSTFNFNSCDAMEGATVRAMIPDQFIELSSSTLQIDALKVYYIPFRNKSHAKITGLCIRHAGTAAASFVVGIHQRKHNGQPGKPIYKSAITAIVTAEGINYFPFSGGSKILANGEYFISMVSDITTFCQRSAKQSPVWLGLNATNHLSAANQYLTETITGTIDIPDTLGTLTQVAPTYVHLLAPYYA